MSVTAEVEPSASRSERSASHSIALLKFCCHNLCMQPPEVQELTSYSGAARAGSSIAPASLSEAASGASSALFLASCRAQAFLHRRETHQTLLPRQRTRMSRYVRQPQWYAPPQVNKTWSGQLLSNYSHQVAVNMAAMLNSRRELLTAHFSPLQ